MGYRHIQIPEGDKITLNQDGSITVPEQPIIPFIEGDGVGVDVTPVMLKVTDAAVAKAYDGQRKIAWMEIYNGEKAAELYDGDWFPQETLDAIREYVVTIKGPLTTPIGGGFRSLNVALRQEMDLYANVRPASWIPGTPSPMRNPEQVDVVVFRENSEDIYSGIEWKAGSFEANRVIEFLQDDMGISRIPFPDNCAIGIKPVSKQGCYRLIRRAIQYAIDHDRESVTLVHKGNAMKFTEGAFKQWGYEIASNEFGATPMDSGPWMKLTNPDTGREIVIKDMITDVLLQQLLVNPAHYDVLVALNQNGDYIADLLAAQVGGIGIVPTANLSDEVAIFEPSHGTARQYAGQDRVNPSSMILSAVIMLRYLKWNEAADIILQGLEAAVASKQLTFQLAKSVEGAAELSCSEFGDAVIRFINDA